MSERDKRPWTPYTLRAEKAFEFKTDDGIERLPARVIAEWKDEQGRKCTSFAAVIGNASALPNDEMVTLFAAAPDLYEALADAQEELRLLRMKDTSTVYDPTLRIRIAAALEKAYPGGKKNENG